MRSYTKLGYDLLNANKDLDPRVALAALQHHEREDGSGYPSKLKGDQIEFFSKIIGLIDVYVAKMSERPHRLKLSFYEVMEELRKDIFQGTFNSYIGMTFLQHMMLAQVGSEVILSNGRKGKKIFVHANYPTKPLVSIEENFVDLSKETTIKIKEILG